MKRIVLVLMAVLLTSDVYAQRRSGRWSNISKSQVDLSTFKAPSIFAFGSSDKQNKTEQNEAHTSFNFETNNAETIGFKLVSLSVCAQSGEECQSLIDSYEQNYTDNNTLRVSVDYELEVCELQEDGTQRFFRFTFSDDQNTNYQPVIYTLCN